MTSNKENLVGSAIRKKFDKEWYDGVIDAYKAPWYHVTYTDGDEEDMTLQQVQKYLLKRKVPDDNSPQQQKKIKKSCKEEEEKLTGRSRRAKAKVVSYTEDHDFDDTEEASTFNETDTASSEVLDNDSLHDSEDDDEMIDPSPPKKIRTSTTPMIIQKKAAKVPSSKKTTRKVVVAKPKKTIVSKTKEPNEHSSSDATNRILKSPYTAGDGLPPISEPQDMFDDMIAKLVANNVDLQCLHKKELRVATMCSGTESPLLAADMISNALLQHHNIQLNWSHVFSCEIEPFKQAYIERNFQPPVLFRDIRELGREQATTAYGAIRDVPLDVDVLIAGTSCVDYSNLNNSKKELDELGESGQTFHG